MSEDRVAQLKREVSVQKQNFVTYLHWIISTRHTAQVDINQRSIIHFSRLKETDELGGFGANASIG